MHVQIRLSRLTDFSERVMKILKAASVEDAVALAEKLKAEGQYDWFRGQIRDWTPSSSLERKMLQGAEAQSECEMRLSRFLRWVTAQPALAYLAQEQNVDALFAVLQHYGFPTTYIDFSTEPSVAGFFASDTEAPPQEPGQCVIYCLNTADLNDFYEFFPPSDEGETLVARPITVDVPNLWRLQSQHGHFLFANHSWYRFYDMDKIVFPWTGVPAFPSREQIYPLHKSALEQLLDDYFFNERRAQNEAALRAMAQAQGKESLFRHIEMKTPEAYDHELFVSPLSISEHWSDNALQGWRAVPVEHFYSTVGRLITLPLRNGVGAPSLADQVRHSIKGALSLQPGLRAQAVEWNFTGLPEDVDQALFKSAAREAWNGMRNYPYTDDDIADAISSLVILCSIPGCRSMDGATADQAFKQWIPDALYVEFGYSGNSYSKAYCSESALLKALDPAWIAKLKKPEAATTIRAAFSHSYDPRLMLDFNQLVSIYAREVIPSQLAMKRPLVLYNPADLAAFGLS